MLNSEVFLTATLVSLAAAAAGFEGFVVGGHYAHISDHPHSAFMAVSCKKTHVVENWVCGGSIVNQAIILSAAHCLENCHPSTAVGISAGSEQKKQGITTAASSFLIHPNYDEELVENDIALIRLRHPLQFGMKVKRVALMRNPPYEEYGTVAGWGLVDEDKYTGTLYLKEATQRLKSKRSCINSLSTMNPGTLCADFRDNNPGYAAEGDSGSALVIRGYIQIGLVSYKLPSISRSITVYTDIAFYYDWIQYNSKRLYCG